MLLKLITMAVLAASNIKIVNARENRLVDRVFDPGKRDVPDTSDGSSSSGATSLINAAANSLSSTDVVSASSASSASSAASSTSATGPISSGTDGPTSSGSSGSSSTIGPVVPQNPATSSSASASPSSASSFPPAFSSSCGTNNTQSLIKCLYGTTQAECVAAGGGCGVLGHYLPISPNDESACLPDVQVAAEVCAKCNATAEGYGVYNQYLTICKELYPIGDVSNGSIPSGDGPTSSMATSTLAVQSISGAGSKSSTGPVVPAATQSSTGDAAGPTSSTGSSKAASTSGTGSSATGSSASTGSGSQSSTSGAASTSIDRVGALPEPSVLNADEEHQGLLTRSISKSGSKTTSEAGLIADEATSSSPTRMTTAPYPGPSSKSDDSQLESDSILATSTLSSFATSSSSSASDTENRLIQAINATELFFQYDIDKSCMQKVDGCTSWQDQIKNSTEGAICETSTFTLAADCSSCVGAAGKSDQETYKAQMEAYGWFKNNCTLATGGVEDAEISGGLLALEKVDGPRATGSGGASKEKDEDEDDSDKPPTNKAASRDPVVKYVSEGAACPRFSLSIAGMLGASVLTVFLTTV